MKLFTSNGDKMGILVQKFPAGETLVRILAPAFSFHEVFQAVTIKLNFKGDDDLMELLLLTDAVKRKYPSSPIHLLMPYFPHARQDRVCAPGESLSAKVVADLINAQGYASVTCWDLHSEVSVALLNNLRHVELDELVKKIPAEARGAILVSPDAGANKKVFNVAKQFGPDVEVVRADKVRNVLTGEITGTTVYCGSVGSRDFLILDDICDGGRTFIELAKELHKLTHGKIYLYVTHGIFSKGYDELAEHIDRIYTANLMGEPHHLVRVI